jgi:GNAT superfamily N-acetyltransferase
MTVFMISDLRQESGLLDRVSDRIWQAFWQESGTSRAAIADRVGESLGSGPIPTTFVAHENGDFLGTASLVTSDEPSRPMLSPWIAAVWVEPHARERGIGAALVQAATDFAFSQGTIRLYLAASTVRRPFYEKMAWRVIERDVPRIGMAILQRDRTDSAG